MSAYKAEKASGFTIDRAFSTRHFGICCGLEGSRPTIFTYLRLRWHG